MIKKGFPESGNPISLQNKEREAGLEPYYSKKHGNSGGFRNILLYPTLHFNFYKDSCQGLRGIALKPVCP
ncbi:hypothetical protein [Lacrimispora sp.]|uniref:hypothetical protein n=1 Tax=Lacrimispora sp. TaxID=2719234 RepID=UPI003995EFAA